jgi:hypothetical protein
MSIYNEALATDHAQSLQIFPKEIQAHSPQDSG